MLNNVKAAGQSFIALNPVPSDGTSGAYVRFFRDTNTTGDRMVEFKKGDNSNTNAASAKVNAAGDGIDWTGKHDFNSRFSLAGTWENPLLIGATRVWRRTTGVLYRKDGSDPSSDTDGFTLAGTKIIVRQSWGKKTANTTYTYNHGLGALPDEYYLEILTAGSMTGLDNSVYLRYEHAWGQTGGGTTYGLGLSATTTQLKYRIYAGLAYCGTTATHDGLLNLSTCDMRGVAVLYG